VPVEFAEEVLGGGWVEALGFDVDGGEGGGCRGWMGFFGGHDCAADKGLKVSGLVYRSKEWTCKKNEKREFEVYAGTSFNTPSVSTSFQPPQCSTAHQA